MALPTSVVEAFAQVLEDTQAAGEPVAEIVTAMTDGPSITAEIIEDAGEGQLLIITAGPEAQEASAMPEAVEATAEAITEATEGTIYSGKSIYVNKPLWTTN